MLLSEVCIPCHNGVKKQNGDVRGLMLEFEAMVTLAVSEMKPVRQCWLDSLMQRFNAAYGY